MAMQAFHYGFAQAQELGNAFTFTTATPSTEAIARAEQLLLSHLSPEQIVQFKANDCFEVLAIVVNREIIYRPEL